MSLVWEKPVIGGERNGNDLNDSPQTSRRILILDDDRDCAMSLCLLCRYWGYDAKCCFDGETALRLIPTFLPTIVLLDLAMPRMTGYDFAQRLRSQFLMAHALIVAVTGYADEKHRQWALECGFDEFFPKPVQLGALQELLAVHTFAHRGALT